MYVFMYINNIDWVTICQFIKMKDLIKYIFKIIINKLIIHIEEITNLLEKNALKKKITSYFLNQYHLQIFD